jgi:hypothetical protein
MTARKATSDKISSAAAEWLAKCPRKGRVAASFRVTGGYCHIPLGKATLLRSMLASLIGQDETKGERRGRK